MRHVLVLSLLAGCASPGVRLSDVTLGVDFGPARRAAMVTNTPSAYRVGLQFATLTGDAAFDLFRTASAEESEVYAFDAAQPDLRSLVADTPIPDEPFDSLDLGITFLEMDLSFRLDTDGTLADRTLRIYFEPVGPYLPGDVTVVSAETEAWAFGPGNMTDDPLLTGLPRAAAYNMDTWPDGRLVADSGPFGNADFWDAAPSAPFHWPTPLPDAVNDNTATITVRVADTWSYTDQAEDAVYDWPMDYGNDWHMDFPEIIAE